MRDQRVGGMRGRDQRGVGRVVTPLVPSIALGRVDTLRL